MPGPTGQRLLIQAATARPRSRVMYAAAVDAAGLERWSMSHTRNTKIVKDIQVIGEALWLNYKGYDIRIEKTKQFNNNNLVITVTPKGQEDYTDRLEVDAKH